MIGCCLPALHSDGFAKELIAGLRALVPIDDATVIHYGRGDLPSLVYCETPETRGSETIERFLAGAFLLDPYYQAAAEHGRFGVFSLKELAPNRFRDSEYYQSWYRNCGFSDECGFLIELGNDAFVNVALGRSKQRRFSHPQLRTLRSLWLAVDQLCKQHWATESGPGDGIREHLHLALDDFGSSLLTEREAQVINLVLHGHSTKSVAERLGIAAETVKLHRKHAYAKLEINSQAELFYLFLDSVMSAKNYVGGDTLLSYLQKPLKPSSP